MATMHQPAWQQPVALPSAASPVQRSFRHYLLLLLLLPALLAPTAFLLARSAFYQRWSTSKWGPILEYSFDPDPQNADVVIFGDSSAFLGLDPLLLNRQLGLHSIVLPATIGSLPVLDDMPLKSYLAHNRPPRLLVFYFIPWNLDYRKTAHIGLLEGEELLVRHGTTRQVLDYGRHHPEELLKFPFRFYSTFTPKRIYAAIHQPERYHATAAALGHVEYGGDLPSLDPSCFIPPDFFASTGTASVQSLVERYQTAATKVLVVLAPIPNCRNSSEVLHRTYAGLTPTPETPLPATLYAADPYYAHVRPNAVPIATARLAETLRPHLQ